MERRMEREALFGSLPVLSGDRVYGFPDAFLVLSGYCIATWSYTQGAYLATLVGFRQLLIGAFFGAVLMLCIYQLPVILSVRYGIDIWIWLRAVFGGRGVMVMTVVIILINYPWYAVCAGLFASSMSNLAALFGLTAPGPSHPPGSGLRPAGDLDCRAGDWGHHLDHPDSGTHAAGGGGAGSGRGLPGGAL